MIYFINEEGYGEVADACMDCEYSYIDDLFYEWCCKRNRCKYTKAEIEQIKADAIQLERSER